MDRYLFATGVFGAGFGLAALLVPPSRWIARRLGVLDTPGHRKVHDEPMPRLGGLAVVLAFTSVVISGHWVLPLLQGLPPARSFMGASLQAFQEVHRVEIKLIALLAGGAVAFLVGLLDDILGRRFQVAVKFTGQVLAACIPIMAGIRTTFLPWEWLNVVVTLLWIVGITNAFNLLDNMDGLSAGVAFVACFIILVNAWSRGGFFVSAIVLAFMGSLLGFLLYNWSPASVFLGDCGSLFIGFTMATLTLVERYVTTSSSSYFPVLMPVVVLAVPLLDTMTVIVIRMRDGRPIYVGDQCHLSHRLLAVGFSKREAVGFIYVATFCLGIGATFLRDATLGETILLLLQAAGIVLLVLRLMFVERRP
jgi:UDP-GlcNAc:undecaprenyl-phosphate GlcNAc-1-phosphate transferase